MFGNSVWLAIEFLFHFICSPLLIPEQAWQHLWVAPQRWYRDLRINLSNWVSRFSDYLQLWTFYRQYTCAHAMHWLLFHNSDLASCLKVEVRTMSAQGFNTYSFLCTVLVLCLFMNCFLFLISFKVTFCIKIKSVFLWKPVSILCCSPHAGS